MTSVPQVTLVMPAKNAIKYIRQAIESLNHQTYPHWDLILVDDASADLTAEEAQGVCRNPIHVIRHQHSQGVAASLNKALQLAGGDIIARMDADDVAHPQRLQRLVTAFQCNSDVDAVASGFVYIDHRGKRLASPKIAVEASSPVLFYRLLLGNPICHPSVAYRKKAPDLAYPTGQLWEDYALWLQTRGTWQWRLLPDPLIKWRIHGKNQSRENPVSATRQLAPILANGWREVGIQIGDDIASEILTPGVTGQPELLLQAADSVRAWESAAAHTFHRREERHQIANSADAWYLRAMHSYPLLTARHVFRYAALIGRPTLRETLLRALDRHAAG